MAGQGDVINMVIGGTFGSSATPWSMVKDYRITAINTAGSLSAWLTAVLTTYTGAWVTALLQDLDEQFTFNTVRAFNRNDPTEEANATVDIDGTATDEGLPLRAAVVMLKETGLRGRSFQGRMSFPAIHAAAQDLGLLDAGALALFVAWSGAVRIIGDATNQGHMTVYSRTLSTDDVIFNTLVTGYSVRNTLGSIRGRQPVS